MGILDRFRGKAAAPKTAKPEYNGEPVLGMYLKADGTMSPVTAKSGWSSGYANYYGAYSKLAIDSTPQGYAYGYVVSVWANRCIEIRSSIIGRMPHKVVSKRTGKPVPNHPLTVALVRSQQNILRKIEWSRMIWGETFIWPVQNTFHYFSDLWWLNNLGVSVVQGAGFIQSFSYVPVEGGRPELFKPSQIAFMKTDNPFSDLRGLSPMEAVLLDVGVDKDVARTLKAWYTNDARPGMLLIPENDLLQEAAQEFTDYWKENFKGSENAGRMGLLPRNIKEIKEMNRAPNIDDVEIREAVRRDICAGFGVPLSIAGAWDDANYQSAPEQRKSLYEDTIIPECEDIASDINNKLLPFFDDSGNTRFEFDVSKILALMEDTEQKEAMLSQRFTSGGLMLNEYRLEIGKEPIPGGDVLYVPSTVIVTPIEKIGQQQQQPAYGIPQDNLITSQPIPPDNGAPMQPPQVQAPAQLKQIPAQVESKQDGDTPLVPKPRHDDRFNFEGYEITNPSQADEESQKAWDESKHPRADDGEFGAGGGGNSGGQSESGGESPDKKPDKKPKPTVKPEAQKPAEDNRQYRDFGSFDEHMVSDAMQPSAPKPTAQQHEAMEYYRDISGNADLNRSLRTGSPLSAEGQKHAKQLDGLLNNSKLEHDTMVYRGIAPSNPQAKIFAEQIKSGQMKPGAILTDKGYASTTLDSKIANGKFAEDGGVVFKIKAPKGSNGLYLNSASDKFQGSRYDGEFRDEKEVVLPRNSQYKVGNIEKVGNQYVVEMTYEGVGAGAGKALQIALQLPVVTQDKNFAKHAIQNTITDELNAWEKKTLQAGTKKAVKFECFQLPAEVQTVIREQLAVMPDADKPTIKALFAKARTVLSEHTVTLKQHIHVNDPQALIDHLDKKKADDFPLATPEEFASYWHEYDSLMQDAGQVWLHDYMERALSGILNKLTDNFQASDILDELSPFRDELAEAWVGTTDNPGIFTRLILAGAARGNEALNSNVSMKPPTAKFEIGIGIDWSLLGQQALDFVRRYVFNLIGGLDNTTRERTRTAIQSWMETGAPLDDLKKALTAIFKDEARAQLIAQTETTRAYNEGSNERWRQAGVNRAKWLTLNDPLVCPSCKSLHGQIANIDQGWELNGQFYTPPQHPGCRCYSKPVL